MAVETGTAADATDLWDKLVTFLTTNAVLVAADQQWAVVWEAPVGAPNESDIVLRGPGLAAADQIYVGLRRIDNVPSDASAIDIVGMTGALPGAAEFNLHVNTTPRVSRMYLSANPMTYWFVASGRRFVAVVKMSTVYQAMYGGFFFPYADPLNYSYPLFVGASSGRGGNIQVPDFRSTVAGHSHFVYPTYEPALSGGWETQAWALSPGGTWLRTATAALGDVAMAPGFFGPDALGAAFSFDGAEHL